MKMLSSLLMMASIAAPRLPLRLYDLTHDREGLTKLEETYVKTGITFPL